MMNRIFKDQNVLITGPTTGIGRDLAELFAEEGAHLILVSRNSDKLERVAAELRDRYKIETHVVALDLASGGAAEKLVSEIRSRGLTVDVLVNNAGFGVYGNFLEEDIQPQIGMIGLHVSTLTYLTHAFLPDMIRRGRGGILNVASTAGFQPLPIQNVYAATKAYAIHFTEALAEELRGKPVRVTCLCPGPTETPFFDTPLMKSNLPAKMSRMGSKEVAQLGFEAFKKGRTLVIAGLQNQLMVFGLRFGPRSIVRRIAKRVVEKKASRAA